MIQNIVIFDLGGVVVPYAPHRILREVGKTAIRGNLFKSKEQKEEILSKLEPFLNSYEDEVTLGKITLMGRYHQIAQDIRQHFKVRIPDASAFLKAHVEAYVAYFSDKRKWHFTDLISRLRNGSFISETPFQVYALTNTEPEIRNINEHNGLYGLFDKVFTSDRLGLKKPDPAIFQHVMQELGLSQRHTAVYIDDIAENVETAMQQGLIGFHYTPRGKQTEEPFADFLRRLYAA